MIRFLRKEFKSSYINRKNYSVNLNNGENKITIPCQSDVVIIGKYNFGLHKIVTKK